jgi:hypothetical protein
MKRFSKILVGVFLSIVGIFLFRKFLNKKDVQVKKTKKKKQKRRVRETKNVITPSYEEKNTITENYDSYNTKPKDNRGNAPMRASGNISYVRRGTSNRKIVYIRVKCSVEGCGHQVYDSEVEIKQSKRNFECSHCKQKYYLNLDTLRSVKEGDRF